MSKPYDVVIIGAGIMGLLGAYEIVQAGGRVAVLDKSRVGNPKAASAGLTRALRTDYPDPRCANLALQAWKRWIELEKLLNEQLLVRTRCLNLATVRGSSYAESAAEWLERDRRKPHILSGKSAVTSAFPQFVNFDYAVLEGAAGLGFASVALQSLGKSVAASGKCALFENTQTKDIRQANDQVVVDTNRGQFVAKKLIIAAGLGTGKLLELIQGSDYRLKLTPARPAECLYYVPNDPTAYTEDRLPIFACLDIGIYGHPLVRGRTNGVKIGRYDPPASVTSFLPGADQRIEAFMQQHMPNLAANATIVSVTDTDQCAYDMSPDGGFVIGPLASNPKVFTAAGFCGTGYKFAPVVAQLMCDFVIGQPFRYDIDAFNPERFNV